MAKYIIQVKLGSGRDPCECGELQFDDYFTEIKPGEHDSTPEELAYWQRCLNYKLAGYELLYVDNCHILSVNGIPVSEQWLVPDQEGMPCAGDTLIVRAGIDRTAFEVEIVENG